MKLIHRGSPVNTSTKKEKKKSNHQKAVIKLLIGLKIQKAAARKVAWMTVIEAKKAASETKRAVLEATTWRLKVK